MRRGGTGGLPQSHPQERQDLLELVLEGWWWTPEEHLDEEEEEEGGDDWEDISEREGRFDMVMNMIPASVSASGGSRASRSSDRAGRRGRGRYQGLADFAANLRPARNMR